MNPIPIPSQGGFFHDLLLQSTLRTEHPFAEIEFEFEQTPETDHDFLLLNGRPDLVSLRTPDQALWALDLP